MSSSNKFQTEKNQRTLLELANQPGNDVCADCKARAPRWASHNLGIFICVNCASIHRKIGTHISKVKSTTLDSWSKEQVENMRQNGNIKSNALYNPDEIRHPPPTNYIDSERDSELEKYIRIDRSAAVAALLGPSRSAASLPTRQQSKIIPSASVQQPPQQLPAPVSSAAPQLTPAASLPPSLPSGMTRNPLRSVSHPVSPPTQSQQSFQSQPQQNGVWGDLQTLQQAPKTIDATLPLQVVSFPPNMTAATQPTMIPAASSIPSYLSAPTSNPSNTFNRLSATPGAAFPSVLQHQLGTVGRSMSLGSGLSATPTGMPFGSSPFQTGMQTSFVPQQTLTPSPNPFAPQPLPAGSTSASMGVGGFAPSPQPPAFMGSASPYGQPTLTQQPSQPQMFQQPQQQMFQPQPTGQFMSTAPNPYTQTQSAGSGTPFLTATPQPYAGSTPSPFGQMQQPQMNMQQVPMQQGYGMQPTGGATTNPFTGWVQQPPQQQQHW
ncbi:hypothetical protein BDY19DRAFT_985604 [Irpex rosettiformis]|uniref:Uncharacterized protein n=1 Tax=Irpex rosettiformis TaxID=378272 RepID=A0ACB8U256_9APHY|nr:hypothetical protein BDY19DRAFT_985604 [Irpex rosettiformis]